MSARDELAAEVADIFLDGATNEASGMDIANAVLAHLCPAVDTAEEVDALSLGSIVMDAFGASCTKVSGGLSGWRRVTPAVSNGEGHWHGPYLPATVLYTPKES